MRITFAFANGTETKAFFTKDGLIKDTSPATDCNKDDTFIYLDQEWHIGRSGKTVTVKSNGLKLSEIILISQGEPKNSYFIGNVGFLIILIIKVELLDFYLIVVCLFSL